MTDMQHQAFAMKVKHVKAKVAVSGYRCNLYDKLFSDWKRHDAAVKACHSVKTTRQECLWTTSDV